ncbi:MAG: hypothetical protein U1F52_17435 [Burkholderiales bacterium]
MSEPTQDPVVDRGNDEQQARREFLQRTGKASASAPAVALLLAASFKNSQAQTTYGPTGGSGSS